MENMTTIRLELGIDARQFVQQVQVHNEQLESQISKGIELALDELTKEDNFVSVVKDATKKQVNEIVNERVFSWEMKNKIQNLIDDKIKDKLDAYADKIASEVVNGMNLD